MTFPLSHRRTDIPSDATVQIGALTETVACGRGSDRLACLRLGYRPLKIFSKLPCGASCVLFVVVFGITEELRPSAVTSAEMNLKTVSLLLESRLRINPLDVNLRVWIAVA
jgi:hypothetical protein